MKIAEMRKARRVRWRALAATSSVLTSLCGVCACGSEPSWRQHVSSVPPAREVRVADEFGSSAHQPELAIEWASSTASPGSPGEGHGVLPHCAGFDAALARVARAVAERQAARQPGFEISELVVMLRALGSPHVWPFVWTLEGNDLSSPVLEERWGASLGHVPSGGERRCGVARVPGLDGVEVVAAVAVDVLADLAPLPTRARLGEWLRLEARSVGGPSAATVVLLGPRGAPRTVPSRLGSGRLHSVFSLDQAGLWRVQVLLSTEHGPRPALEAWVFVDEEPSFRAGSSPAPGEAADVGLDVPLGGLRASLLQMVNAARFSEQRAPLRREARLDDLAQEHAEAMLRAGRTAHDTGQGLPAERVARAGVPALRVGENVARARRLPSAHRALWDSPAHRGNLLDDGFDAVGLGIVVEPSVGVWVCELFVDYANGVTGMVPPGR